MRVFSVMKRKFKKYLRKIKKFMWILHILSCVITVVFFDVCIKIVFKFSIIDLIQDSWLLGMILLFKKLRNIPEKIIHWWEEQKIYFHEWIGHKKKTGDNKIYKFLETVYPDMKDDELELKSLLMDTKEAKQLAKDLGMSDAEIKKIL
jgi:hypothetical protein